MTELPGRSERFAYSTRKIRLPPFMSDLSRDPGEGIASSSQYAIGSFSCLALRLPHCLVFLAAPVAAADFPAPTEGDFVIDDFQFTTGEALPRTESALHDHRHAGEERRGHGDQRRADHARHRRQRTRVPLADLRRAALRRGPTAGRDEILHHPAGRYRAREIQQAERRAAHEVPALHVHGHGARRVPAGHREARRESSAAGDGDLDGRDAHVDVGRRCIRTSWTR